MQLLLSQYSGLKDVIVQTAMAGRVASELEPLIGWFANGAAVRTKLDGGVLASALLDHALLYARCEKTGGLPLNVCCNAPDLQIRKRVTHE